MTKTFTIDVKSLKNHNTFNLKGVDTLQISTNHESDAYKSMKASGNTVTLEMYATNERGVDAPYATIVLKNCDSLEKVYYATSLYNQDNEYDTANNWIDEVLNVVKNISDTDKEGGTVVTGTIWDDTINMNSYDNGDDESVKGLKINAGKGNDTITGSGYNDTITAGEGTNIINYSGGEDIIIAKKNENLKFDLSGKTVSFKSNKKGSDVILSMGEDDSITLKDFIKSNGIAGGSAQYTTNGTDYTDIDLNNIQISYDSDDFSEKKNNASLTSTKRNDLIEVSAEDFDSEVYDIFNINIKAGEGNNEINLYDSVGKNSIISGSGNDTISLSNTSDTETKGAKTTVKAGAGENVINIEGTGRNYVTTGKNNDTFNISGSNTTKIKAGAGTNTINISSTSADITLESEKVKATNNIGFYSNLNDLTSYADINDLTKINNNLIINNVIQINNYFVKNSKTENKINGFSDLKDLMTEYGIGMNVIGQGTIKGTDYNDNILVYDSENYVDFDEETTKAKNDKIYAGKGNDTIDAGMGKNMIYLNKGDGIDTIIDGGGSDTLIFQKGSKIRFGHVKSGGKYDLHIYYSSETDEGGNYTDYVILNDVATEKGDGTFEYDLAATSVEKLKVGSKTYKLDALLERTKINGTVGTIGNDDIWVNKERGNVVVIGDAGSDVIDIGSNDSKNENNIDPTKYLTKNITPTVYTYTKNDAIDTSEGTIDRINSYASKGGTYYAQSAGNDIKVYGNTIDSNGNVTGTDDTYYANVSQYTKIYDEGGNDVLYIKDAASTDLKLLFTISKDFKSINDNTITEYTKDYVEKSFQELMVMTTEQRTGFLTDTDGFSEGIWIDYWGDKADNLSNAENLATLNSQFGYFGGGIEKIVASDGKYITSDDIAQVAENVAEWLGGNDHDFGQFNSVEAAMTSTGENADAIKASLLAVFDNVQWH